MDKIAISEIIILNRKREVKDIDALIQSIREIGLLNPITINKHKVLISGYHRLQACKALGWKEIPAVIINLDNLKSELAQIDENIVRNELTALENAEQLKRRKDIYEILHPDARPDLVRNNRLKQNLPLRQLVATVKPVTFVNDASSKTGKSERSIQRYIKIASSLSKELRDLIRGSAIEDNESNLMTLAKIEDPAKQKELVEKVISGQAKSVRAAINQEKPPKPKTVDTTKDMVPTKAYLKILDDYYKLELKYFKLEAEYNKLNKEAS